MRHLDVLPFGLMSKVPGVTRPVVQGGKRETGNGKLELIAWLEHGIVGDGWGVWRRYWTGLELFTNRMFGERHSLRTSTSKSTSAFGKTKAVSP